MAVVNGPVYVEWPSRGADLRYGLFTVVPPRDFTDVHMQLGGIQYEISYDLGSRPYDVTCATGATKTFDAGPTTVTAAPVVIYTSMTCGSVGMTEERARAFVSDRAKYGEQPAVELAFSNSANGLAPGLANNGAATQLAATATITAAISVLENWLYVTKGYGATGIIHAPAIAEAYFRDYNSMQMDKNGVWRTPMQTAISFGNYSGNKVNGSAPAASATNIYITPQMSISRDTDSNVFFAPYGEVFNKAGNQFLALMERNYIIGMDFAPAATEATLAP